MNGQPKYEVFISYRRDGGVDYARMIYLELKGRGYNTFFDYNSLRDGKFNDGIFKAIDECRYFILVLSVGSLDRCLSKDDWVRHEIEYALSKGKAIIPVCPSGSVRGFPEKMPASFEPLRNLQISMLQMDDLFDKSFDKIVEDRFAAEFREGRSPITTAGGVTSKIFKRIGIGVIVAIIGAACIVGFATMKSREAEKARAEQSRQLAEKMMAQAAEEKKAADAAKEKARQEALAAQKEQARIEAELKAKEKADAELRAVREAKIRAEAEANAAKNAAGGVVIQGSVLFGGNLANSALDKEVQEFADIRSRLFRQTLPGGVLHGGDAEYAEAESRANAWLVGRAGKPEEQARRELKEIRTLYEKILNRIDTAKAHTEEELKKYLGPTFRARTAEDARRDFEELSFTYQNIAEKDLAQCVNGSRIRRFRKNETLLATDCAKRIFSEYGEVSSEVSKLKAEGWTKGRLLEERYDILMKFYDIRRRVEKDANYLVAIGQGQKCHVMTEAARAAFDEVGMHTHIEYNPFSPSEARKLLVNGTPEPPAGPRPTQR